MKAKDIVVGEDYIKGRGMWSARIRVLSLGNRDVHAHIIHKDSGEVLRTTFGDGTFREHFVYASLNQVRMLWADHLVEEAEAEEVAARQRQQMDVAMQMGKAQNKTAGLDLSRGGVSMHPQYNPETDDYSPEWIVKYGTLNLYRRVGSAVMARKLCDYIVGARREITKLRDGFRLMKY